MKTASTYFLTTLFACSLIFATLVHAQFPENVWYVGAYGSLRNQAAAINTNDGTLIVDGNICHLKSWTTKHLTSKERGIKATIDGTKTYVFDYKAEGPGAAMMTFKPTQDFLINLKKGANVHFSYNNKGTWQEISFPLTNSSKAITQSNDGYSYDLPSQTVTGY
jgi:hypothetical protein